MKCSAVFSLLATVIVVTQFSPAFAVTEQTAANLLGGRPYLWVEGESASSIEGTPGSTWAIAEKGGPEMSFVSAGTSVPIMPATSNASGDKAIYSQGNNFGDVEHTSLAHYQLKFITPGTYQFYLRQSQYDSNNNGNFLNEDSIFLPPEFNKNTDTDWIGFQSEQFDEAGLIVNPPPAIPTPGYALDPSGWTPQDGDHTRDGLLELANWGIKDKGVWVQHTPDPVSNPDMLSANVNFNWYHRPAYQGTTPPGNGFDGFFGLRNQFVVTEEMVGEVVNFEMGMREVNIAIDGFMFIQVNDLVIEEGADYPTNDILDIYSQAELDAAILPVAIAGDYNGNGTVDAADYVVWRNGDSPDDTQAGYDLWKANFGKPLGSGAGSSLGAVPEPGSLLLFVIGMIAFRGMRVGQRSH